MTIPGSTQIKFFDRLGDSWRDLADALEIPARTARAFAPGEEPREMWHWLTERDRLKDLPAALAEIRREDLIELLTASEPASAVTADVIDFATLITERTKDFIGRRRFRDRLWQTFGDAAFRSGYLCVSGEPGIGKTALLAKVVQEHHLVHHFNSVLTGITSQERFLRNVCAQLILSYKLPCQELPAHATSDSSFLLDLLARAAARERVVVAVDAIDEAAMGQQAQNWLFLPPALPPSVFFVVTARHPEDMGLYVDERRDMALDERDPENEADVREYLGAFLERHHRVMARRLTALGISQQAFADMLADRSEGNFMYLRHVLQAIRDGSLGGADAGGIDELPRGLTAYYVHLEQQLARRAGTDPGRELAILGVLAAWPAPLTAPRLALFAGERLAAARGVLRRWSPFLNQLPVEGEPGYALYHASFREFLASRLDMSQVRARIASAIEDGRA